MIAAGSGDYGKPRPSVVVQTSFFNATHTSIVICPMTSDVVPSLLYRIDVEPDGENGLRRRSQVMVDKVMALRRERIGDVIGILDRDTMLQVDRSLAFWLGLAD